MYCKWFLVFKSLFCIGIALDLPSGIQKCKRSDSDFNGCLKTAIEDALPKLEKGVPELGFASVQPLYMPILDIKEGKGGVHIVQRYKHTNFFNFFRPKIEAIDVTITDTGFDVTMDTFYEEIIVEGEYCFVGRILVRPVVGQGPFVLKFKNVKMHVLIHGKEIKKNGQAYYEIQDFKIRVKPEGIKIKLENLFNGDQRLSDQMLKLMNDNSKKIWEDIHFEHEEAIGLKFKSIANAIFEKIPNEQIFPK